MPPMALSQFLSVGAAAEASRCRKRAGSNSVVTTGVGQRGVSTIECAAMEVIRTIGCQDHLPGVSAEIENTELVGAIRKRPGRHEVMVVRAVLVTILVDAAIRIAIGVTAVADGWIVFVAVNVH